MSGAKRRTKYRKHVEDMALNAFPEPGEGAQIVQVTQSAGGNLFEVPGPSLSPPFRRRPDRTHSCRARGARTQVEAEGGATALALLPTKFRNLIWVRRGTRPPPGRGSRMGAAVTRALRSGHFLLVSSSGDDYETAGGDKGRVRFLVEHILSNDQVKHLVEGGKWCAGAPPPWRGCR